MVTDDKKLEEKVRMLSEYGSPKKYHHDILGGNHRLDTIQAAVLNTKLPYLDKWNEQRQKAAERYEFELRPFELIKTPVKNNNHVYHLYVIQTPFRDELQKYLKDHNVDSGLHYPIPLHLTKAFQYLGYKEGDFPVAECVAKRILSLPMFPGISEDEVSYVNDNIVDFYIRVVINHTKPKSL